MSTNNPFAPQETADEGAPRDGDLDLGDPAPAAESALAEAPQNGAAAGGSHIAEGAGEIDLSSPLAAGQGGIHGLSPADGEPVPSGGEDAIGPAPETAGSPAAESDAAAGLDAVVSSAAAKDAPQESLPGEKPAAEEPAAAPPPEELPVDPVWLAGFVAALASARDTLLSLRKNWDGRPVGTVEDAALADAVAALDKEHAELIERVRSYGLAPAEEAPKAEGKSFAFDEGPAPSVAPSASKRPGRGGGGGESAMMWQMLQVVLGGVLAIPTAQLILWWLPFGLDRDPFELAPKLPDWASFLAPQKLRGGGSGGAPNGNPNPPLANNGGKQNNTQRPTNPTFNPNDKLPLPGGDPVLVPDPDADKKKPMDPDLIDPLTPDPGLPKVGPPVPAIPLPPAIGPLHAPVISSNDFLTRIDVLDKLERGFRIADEEARTGLIKDFYTACVELARARTFVDPNGSMVNERIGRAEGILRPFHEDKLLMNRLGRVGARWTRHGDRKNLDGTLVTGIVEEIRPAGRYFETRVSLTNSAEEKEGVMQPPMVVSVLSIADPKGRYQVGSEVFVLGAIILEPKTNLVGYAGDEPRVIWRGHVVLLSEPGDVEP